MTEDEVKQILQLLAKPQPKISEVEFRLYYDDNGKVITYTSEKLPGNYLIITKEQYNEARNDVVVKDGKIMYTHKTTHIMKYTKNLSRGIQTSKYDINVITKNDSVFYEYLAYEIK